MKKSKMTALCIIAGIVLLIIILFKIPVSPTKSTFSKDVILQISKNQTDTEKIIKAEDFSDFPPAIQKYVEACGYIGTPHKNYLRMFYKNVDFMQGKTGPKLKIDYTQMDFASEPCRLALIDSSMFGIPFEGYDYYKDGKGGMKGVIAKCITLFNQTGAEMDKACLATYLAESMFLPSSLLNGFTAFEEIDDYRVRATSSYGGQSCTGIFTFNQNYEYISFTTNDRAVSNNDGTFEYVPWSALCGDYVVSPDGIKYPSTFKAVWNYTDGDFVYFDGKISEVR